MFDMVADVFDPFRGERMRAEIRILADPCEQLLALKNLKELKQPPRRLAASVEKSHRCVIGRGFLRNRVLHERPLCDTLCAQHCCPVSSQYRCGCAYHHRNDAFDAGIPRRLLKARQMSSGDVAGLVSEYADQLVRRFSPHDQTRIDKFVLATSDK